MSILSDLLLGFGAMAAAVYCFILSRKLSKLKGLDQDLGAAIAVLSHQVDEMTQALSSAQKTASESVESLDDKAQEASKIAERLDFMIAALQDLPEQDSPTSDISEATEEMSDQNFIDQEKTVFVRNNSRKAS